MIVRIVRMHFRPEAVVPFMELFRESYPHISTFPGVLRLDLMRDARHPEVFYTYSHWTGEEALEAYRVSPLFEDVWARTKVLFAEKAKAYSLEAVPDREYR